MSGTPPDEGVRKALMNGSLEHCDALRSMLVAVYGPQIGQSMTISLLLYAAAQMVLQAGTNPDSLWKERTANAFKAAMQNETPDLSRQSLN